MLAAWASLPAACRKIPVGETAAIDSWLNHYPVKRGVFHVDPPVHFGGNEDGEKKYMSQMKTDFAFERRVQSGLERVLTGVSRPGGMTETASGAALEIGAGHGILSRPLIKLHRYAVSVIADSSPTFLEHISTTLKGRRNQQATRFATLSPASLTFP